MRVCSSKTVSISSAKSPEDERPRRKKKKRRRREDSGKGPAVDPTPQRDSARKKKRKPRVRAEAPEQRETKKAEPEKKDAPVARAASASGELGIDENWFSASTDKAWEENYLQEHTANNDKRYRSWTIAGLIILAVSAIALVIYSVTYEDPEEEESSLRSDSAWALLAPPSSTPLD